MLKSRFSLNVPRDLTVGQAVMNAISKHGSKVAIVDSITDRQYTYADISTRIKNAGSALRRRGLRKGDVMCFYSANSLEFPIVFLAASTAGVICTAINPAYTVDEFIRHLKLTRAEYIVADADRLPYAKQVARVVGNIKEIFVLENSPDKNITSTDALYSDPGDLFKHETVDPVAEVFCILPSSGTTGIPKGVMMTHFNVMHTIMLVGSAEAKTLSNLGNHTGIGFAPQFHISGLGFVLSLFYSGDRIILMSKFDFRQFLVNIQKYKVTYLPLVPPIAVLLIKDELVSQYDLTSVTDITCSAASLKEETANELSRKFGVKVRQLYGMTETAALGTYTPVDGWKSGSVGVLSPTVEGQIADVNTGLVLGPNQIGEIWLRSPGNMKGYLGNDQATRDTVDSQGWLHTGDIGYFDDDGHLYITGRIKELIKYKGFQVSPVELEGLLLEHPAIADVAVIGIPDLEAGELPKALVVKKVATAHVAATDIINFLHEKVAPHKRLRGGVEFVDTIPKSPSGKILRQVIIADQLAKLKTNSKI